MWSFLQLVVAFALPGLASGILLGAGRLLANGVAKSAGKTSPSSNISGSIGTRAGLGALPAFVAEPLLFIGINSAPENFARRVDVRSSWLQDPVVHIAGIIEARFIVGKPVGSDADAIEDDLQVESKRHNDFLRLPVHDTYDSLTNKTIAFLQWYVSKGPRTRFLMKLDDDTYPHVQSLVRLLWLQQPGYTYLGYFHECALVKRSGKNAESLADFQKPVFPTYASGSGYILSSLLVHDLVLDGNVTDESASAAGAHIATDSRPILHNEDASIGVWVDRVQNSAANSNVSYKPIKATLFGCSPGDTLSMNLGVGDMSCMWEKQKLRREEVCCGKSKLGLLQTTSKLNCKLATGIDRNSNAAINVTRATSVALPMTNLEMKRNVAEAERPRVTRPANADDVDDVSPKELLQRLRVALRSAKP